MSVSSPAHLPASNSLFAPERLTGTLALVLGVGSHAINGFVTTAVLPDIIRDRRAGSRFLGVFLLRDDGDPGRLSHRCSES